MDTKSVEYMVYDEEDGNKRRAFITACTDAETLHLYAYNYNWDDGFEEPTLIMQNPNCSMSTALTLFYLADGVEYLSDTEQEADEYEQDWQAFVKNLYNRIIKGDFPSSPIRFEPPITRVERYEMEKDLSDEESVFYTPIDGIDCNIDV